MDFGWNSVDLWWNSEAHSLKMIRFADTVKASRSSANVMTEYIDPEVI